MFKRLTFWLSLLVSLTLPAVAFAASKTPVHLHGLTPFDVAVIGIATVAAFLWVLSVII